MKLPAGYVPGVGLKKATAYGGFGQKLMESMGWSKGEGLGVNRQGIVSAIDVKEKQDTVGLGGNFSWDWGSKYWSNAYDSAIQQIEVGEASDSDSSDSGSDDEHAHGAPRNLDGTTTSAQPEELKLAKRLARRSKWTGRFNGRVGKLARIREQEEAALAALGKEPGHTTTGSTTASVSAAGGEQSQVESRKKKNLEKKRKQEVQGGDGEGAGSEASTWKRRKKEAVDEGSCGKAAERERAGGEATTSEPAEREAAALKPLPEGWWGAGCFVRADVLLGEQKAVIQLPSGKKGFTEDTQAAVYNAAMDQERRGRRGLGRAATNMGKQWRGSKLKFDWDAEGEEEERRGQPQRWGASMRPDSTNSQEEEAPVKWIRLIKQSLKQAEGRSLSLKLLRKAVSSRLLNADVCGKELSKLLRKKVKAHAKLKLEGNVVSLCA